jgi:hypothetical protein
MTTHTASLPAPVLPGWLDALLREDEQTKGSPTLRFSDPETVLHDLDRLLIDIFTLEAYIEKLANHYDALWARPYTRHEGGDRNQTAAKALLSRFPHKTLMPVHLAKAIVEEGTPVLRHVDNAQELSRLLLNPFALWDLADWIDLEMPEAWREQMTKVGQEYWAASGIHEPHFEPTPAFTTMLPKPIEQLPPTVVITSESPWLRASQGTVRKDSDSWEIKYTAEMGAEAAALIERITGDRVGVVTLTLRQHTLDEKHVAFSLGCAPPPSLEPVKIVVEFANQQKREFTLAVPPFPMEFDETMLCESLPIDAVSAMLRAELSVVGEQCILALR